jgi:hypothetical protein
MTDGMKALLETLIRNSSIPNLNKIAYLIKTFQLSKEKDNAFLIKLNVPVIACLLRTLALLVKRTAVITVKMVKGCKRGRDVTYRTFIFTRSYRLQTDRLTD